ncbi:MAG: carboxymuconolactone decarboxylase family protein, partial [Dermatophilaceae bacterium]
MTTRIPAREITGPYGILVKAFSRRMFGRVPASLGVMWHNLPVLKASMGFGQKVQKLDGCDRTLKSFAHMAVASYVGCSWCLDYNHFVAYHEGLDVDRAREIPRWRESDVFGSLERDVLEYAEAMSDTPPTVTDELVARLL